MPVPNVLTLYLSVLRIYVLLRTYLLICTPIIYIYDGPGHI